MKDNGVFLIKKEIGGIDVNLHAVRIAHGYASPETAELTDVSDCVYFAVKGRCNVALYEKNFTVNKGTAFYAARNTKARCRQIGDEPFEYYSIAFDSLDCRNVFARMNLSKTQPILRFDDSIAGSLARLYETAKTGTVASAYAGISQLYAILSALAERYSSQESDDIENEYVEKAIAFMSSVCIGYTALIWGILHLFPVFFIRIFSDETALIQAAIPSMQIYFFGFFFMSLQFSGQSTFTAMGKSRQAIFFSLLRKAFIVIPLTLWLPRFFTPAVNGVFAAEPISNLIGGTASFVTMLVVVGNEIRKNRGADQ